MKKREELETVATGGGKHRRRVQDNTDTKKDMYDASFRRLICIDFDGVLHQYSQGWKGPGNIYDPPVPGAMVWLRELIADERFEPMIYSSRPKHPDGLTAMKTWLLEHGLPETELKQLGFPTEKPAAWLTVDDRCFLFRGQWPSREFMLGFVGWTKRPELVQQFNGGAPTDAEFLRGLAFTLSLPLTLSDRWDSLESASDRLVRIADELDGRHTRSS